MSVQDFSEDQRKRKKIRNRLFTEKEEEEYNRRKSLRKRKGVRYAEDHDETEDKEEEDEDEEGQEDNEQPGPSTQNTGNQIIQEERLLSVTCGNKKGILDTDKLRRGEECIECGGCWFAPPAFEDFGGKGASKKWKSTIFHENKPLQFYFDEKVLTTEGYKRKANETLKPKEILSISEESDIQPAEETEEDDVKDDDWHPDSEELVLETEEGGEERVEAENGGEFVDSGDDKSKEEEDEMENGEMEDDQMPAVADNDSESSICEERKKKLKISPSAKCALQRKLTVVLERLPENGHQSKCTKHPLIDRWRKSVDEAQSEAASEHNGSETDDPSITAARDASQMSDVPPIVGDVGGNKEEFMQSREEKDGQREIETETERSPRCLSATATSSPHIKPDIVNRTEDTGSISNNKADLSSSPQLLITEIKTVFVDDKIDDGVEKDDGEMETGFCGRNEKIWERKDLDMSRCEERQPSATVNVKDVATNTEPIQRDVKKGSMTAITLSTTSGHNAAQLQVPNLETSLPQKNQASDSNHSPHMVERPSSVPFIRPNLDTMDLDQLKREKIKLQLKVLQLQEEYYSLKIKELKKYNSFTQNCL